MFYCELCGSNAREGDLGESKYICDNTNCERSNVFWARENKRKALLPLFNRQQELSVFSKGKIEFYEARWIGDGSAMIKLQDNIEFICHVRNGKFEPFDYPYYCEMGIHLDKNDIEEIKCNMLQLIQLRESFSAAHRNMRINKK
ncbi:hypothetical protein ABD91_03260 [Lysinibacillus sphaericus]|uniref:hypothetical protein n=1 Tax=Lysinibacillus sphaericus TaxID=1421 RepID=UPI0018CE3403|nr:hypothetical protein [Lysinibacillus sphaericus]MBG9689941.1 hypothetical protein [Lysinibacillus sphaericus]